MISTNRKSKEELIMLYPSTLFPPLPRRARAGAKFRIFRNIQPALRKSWLKNDHFLKLQMKSTNKEG
jgi:hypothetical protein